MAHRLMQERRKCFKSPNIFRDKQEYSSLYTISSGSSLSARSAEMSTPKPQQQRNIPQQNRIYRGEHHKGDSAETLENYNYRKLPTDVSQELQRKVYSYAHKKFYDDKTDNGQEYAEKSYYPMYVNDNRQRSASRNYPQNYTISRLEESYWAKWKPNRCGNENNWQRYEDQTKCKPCNRRPRYATTGTMAEDCMKMLAQVTNSRNQRPRITWRDDKPLEVIREPTEIRESNSSDIGAATKKANRDKTKSKCSCCSACTHTASASDDEKTSEMTTTNQTTSKRTKTPTDTVETSQEEYEHLYDDTCKEYESDLMNAISEYEMQREQEEMREVEHHLVEEERKRKERASQKQEDRVSYERAYAKVLPRAVIQESHHSNVYKQYYDSANGEKEEADSLPTDAHSRPTIAMKSRVHTPETSRMDMKESAPPNGENVQESEPQPQADVKYQQGNAGASPKESLRGNSRRGSPTAGNSRRGSPTAGNSRRGSPTTGNSRRGSPTTGNSRRDSPTTGNSRLGSPTGGNKEREEQKPIEADETPNKQVEENGVLDDANPRQNLAFDIEVTPHLSTSIEYSEPEIAILKHTDSFIINSRRQKEEKPRKPQPKFLKLTKTPFTAPPVKGHTYPLKPVLKKIKTQAPPAGGVGTTRPMSPATPKARTSSRQFQPAYLTRH